MTLSVPSHPVLDTLTEQEILLDLACSLYARGRLGRVGAADLAGVGLSELQTALGERHIAVCDEETLEREARALSTVFGE